MKSTFHKCVTCKAPFDVGVNIVRLYCDICKAAKARKRSANNKVKPTIKTCGVCGKDLVTAHKTQLYHTECKRLLTQQRTREYKRSKQNDTQIPKQ